MGNDYEQLAALAAYRMMRPPLPVKDNAGQRLTDAKPGNAAHVTRQAQRTEKEYAADDEYNR